MNIYSDERLINLGIISGTVGRDFGSAREKKISDKIFDSLGIPPSKILGLKQVHGNRIIAINSEEDLKNYKANNLHEADGWLLSLHQTGAMILTADCVPLYLWSAGGKYVSLTHCGWRGIAQELPKKAAELIKEKTTEKLQAYIGPHIKDCCFEVKEDVASKFPKETIMHRENKIFVNLDKAIILQLTAAGVEESEIQKGCHCQCTSCNNRDFFSYRRDGTTDALLSFVYKL
ncbi:MAG: polyphenol oxidase family protein [Elusimicrobiaceae bacterium]|nr:polyphenol oxidase family protein [Elusimicrobiaceae bacterium]